MTKTKKPKKLILKDTSNLLSFRRKNATDTLYPSYVEMLAMKSIDHNDFRTKIEQVLSSEPD